MARIVLNVLIAIVVVGILGAIGAGIYNAGVAAGLAQTGAAAGGAAPYVYGWGLHPGFFGFGFGFGFLGLLFPILFLVLIFGLVRVAFGRGRRGWGHGGRWSGDPRFQAWQAERERQLADLHRRLHESDAGAPPTDASTGSPGGSGTPGAAR